MGQLYVVIKLNSEVERTVNIEDVETLIGRQHDCAICLPKDHVSRKHAMIIQKENDFYLRDLGSMNGTALNGKIIVGDELIVDGADVEIPPYRLKLCLNFTTMMNEIAGSQQSTLKFITDDEPAVSEIPDEERLTEAQRRVYSLFLEGFIEKEIAANLGLSIHTVHDHAKAIYKTLMVSTRGELLARWGKYHQKRSQPD